MTTFIERIQSILHPAPVAVRKVQHASPVQQTGADPHFSVVETDNSFYSGTKTAGDLFRDRLDYDRKTILAETLRAWRTNPVARWVVQLTDVFVLGTGFEFDCSHKKCNKFLREFWEHPLNLVEQQLPKWLDEQTRSGDLFLLFSVDQAGMSYVRAVPSERIKEIQTMDNDYQQEVAFIQDDLNATPWMAYNPEDPNQRTFMLHFPINQPVGCIFGESDLSPLLPWIGRLSTIVGDRVILNHVRSLISFVLQGKFMDAGARQKRQREIELHPPKQGSILVTDDSEVWSVLSAKLEGGSAAEDILAVKKMIAVGVGVPLHYLAEPESSTRTTAEAAGTPTFKRFDDRQRQYKRTILTILQTVLAVRRRVDKGLPVSVEIKISAGDITERDNSLLSLAAARIEPVLADLYDRKLIEEPEYLRIFYRMIGEFLDEDKIPIQGIRRDIDQPTSQRPANIQDQPEDPDQLDEGQPN